MTLLADGRRVFPAETWTLRQGEEWALVGPDGSGKSVLAGALSGEVPLADGDIVYRFPRRPAYDGPPGSSPEAQVLRLRTGDLLPGLDPSTWYREMRWNAVSDDEGGPTVREALSAEQVFGLHPFEVLDGWRPPADLDRRRRGLVRRLGLSPLLERRIAWLSTGESRKLLIASGVLRRPRILIVDSPLASLDAASRRAVRAVLRQATRGAAVVVLASRPDEVPPECDRLLRVEGHRVVEEGGRSRVRSLLSTDRSGERARSRPGPRRSPDAAANAAADTTPAPPLLEIRGATVAHGGRPLLSDVSWTIREGEHWALVGPNGAGKTTLLGLVTGDHPQVHACDVRVLGHRPGVGSFRERVRSQIGLATAEMAASFDGGLTAGEVVATGLFDTLDLYRPVNRRHRQATDRALSRLHARRLSRRPFGALSEGERRAILVARAIVRSPRLVLLDEPCLGLDARQRAVVLAAIGAVARRGDSSVVVVTHRREEIPPSVHRVLRLRRGRVVDGGGRSG